MSRGLFTVHIPLDVTLDVEADSPEEAIALSYDLDILIPDALKKGLMNYAKTGERYATCTEWERTL